MDPFAREKEYRLKYYKASLLKDDTGKPHFFDKESMDLVIKVLFFSKSNLLMDKFLIIKMNLNFNFEISTKMLFFFSSFSLPLSFVFFLRIDEQILC